MRFNLMIVTFVVGLGFSVQAEAREAQVDLGDVVETHLMIPMRDGVKLSTYLYTPKGKGPWPVLYEQRYADLKGAETRKGFARMASAGYVVAAQNFRGAGLSEGTWVGYRALGWGKQQDGYDTVEWLAAQPWSTGKVGTFGSSQAGFAQNFLAVARPPHLTCQYMIDTGLSLFHEGYRIGGATRPERFKGMGTVCRNPDDNLQLLKEWFAHPTYDSYWETEDCSRHFSKMDVPCFTVGSWFDFMCVGSIESFIGRQHRGGPNSLGKQQLLIGPWLHGRFKETNQTGELSFPENARFAMDSHMIRWFDHYLKGMDNGVDRESTVRYYVMGAVGETGAPGNEWRTSTDWPVRAEERSLYLSESGKLEDQPPTAISSSTSFLADPVHPNTIPAGAFPGAKDARGFEKQAEVRTFTSKVLTEPVEWTGKVKADLYFSSTAKDTDVIVRVSDVYPDGRSILLIDYIRRARYRDGYEKEVFLEPGKITKVAFDVGWISQIFNRGHRIRVTIAGTGAHFYEQNPNTGEALTLDFPSRTFVAKNTVYHEQPHSSRLIVPVRSEKAVAQDQPPQEALVDLEQRINKLRNRERLDVADLEVFTKGIRWALRYQVNRSPADQKLIDQTLERCRARVLAVEQRGQLWREPTYKTVRGFRSRIDQSVQPYGIVIPSNIDRAKAVRLDVVLHGSSKPTGMSELQFMSRFDEREKASPEASRQDFIELHPLGRVENGYRWAGETDIFEAIEDVCRKYSIDRDRIVLRGMSMGASGTWHLGLKHPDRFVALGPYCGYVDTHRFSETPLPSFVKVGPLPVHQEKCLHLLDSVDYAANAGVVPAIACMGEKDVFFDAHEIMRIAMAREGLAMVNLISPGTGHVIDPVTHQEQMRRIETIALKGIDHAPRDVRFVTWSLKYSRCHWIQIQGLEEHYARAEIDASVGADGSIEILEPKNISRFDLLPPVARGGSTRVLVAGRLVTLRRDGASDGRVSLKKRSGRWVEVDPTGAGVSRLGKQSGLQGPIDDAFTTPFLCVRGTGKPWNADVARWSERELEQFVSDWSQYFRGDLQVKDDTAVTPDDLKRFNLILFGDPGSNLWIRKCLPKLPIRWTQDELTFGSLKVSARDHAPKLIQPNPLQPGRYVVLNSGHTFGAKELGSLNYLLFPRLGDWALVKLPDQKVEPRAQEQVVRVGFFDENWSLPNDELP